MRNTGYNTIEMVIPGFSESKSDIGNDMPGISSDILGTSIGKKNIQGISRICDNRLPYP